MEGFCPVTLVEREQWQQADKRWGAIHRGRLYLFAGPAEQQRFLANPDRFSPALSGFDPVMYAERGQLVEGKRRYGTFFYDQVYLFSDEAALRRFEQNPAGYADHVHQAMLRNDLGTRLR